MGLYRATGRFVWLSCYMIFAGSMYFVHKYLKEKIANIIIVICLTIQIIDLYSFMSNRFEYNKMEIDYNINEIAWEQMLSELDNIAYIRLGQTTYDEMREGYYKIAKIASKNDCTLNDFYFAREIKNVNETVEKYINQLKTGKLENNYIYVIKQQNDNKWWNHELETFELDGYIVIKPNIKI